MIMENILTKVLPQEGGLAGSRSGVYNGVIGLLGLFTLVGVAFASHPMVFGPGRAHGVPRGARPLSVLYLRCCPGWHLGTFLLCRHLGTLLSHWGRS